MTFDGWAAARNIAPLSLPIDRFLNLIYYWATKDADERGLQRFNARLWMPPPGEEAKGPWSPEAETAAFTAFAGEVNKR